MSTSLKDIYTFWISYNGTKNTDLDVRVVQRPNIPKPKKRVNHVVIAGRDGTLTETDGTYEDIEISVPMNYIVKNGCDFMPAARAIKKWIDGDGILKMSDDTDVFYKVKDATIDGDIERILRRAGIFSAHFICDPYTYLESGKSRLSVNDCVLNPYRASRPIYYINGEGLCTLTVNGKSLSVNVEQNVIVDTNLLIMYKQNGSIQKAIGRFDYDDFVLQPGINDISITRGALSIQPNWRML